MKNVFIVLFSILLLAGCNKTDNFKNTEKVSDFSNNHITNNLDKTQNDKTEKNVNTKYSIENISFFIFSDLKLKWKYEKIIDLLENLSITDYSYNKRIVKNTIHSGEGFYYVYDIEDNIYKITISSFSLEEYSIAEFENIEFENYSLDSIEIKLNEEYKELFPYTEMKDFKNDQDFGNISEQNQEENNIFYYMRYGEDDSLGYCNLKFKDGLLESIIIYSYTP